MTQSPEERSLNSGLLKIFWTPTLHCAFFAANCVLQLGLSLPRLDVVLAALGLPGLPATPSVRACLLPWRPRMVIRKCTVMEAEVGAGGPEALGELWLHVDAEPERQAGTEHPQAWVTAGRQDPQAPDPRFSLRRDCEQVCTGRSSR